MTTYDPASTRLSPNFLLSDVIGCTSVYKRGLPNVFDDPTGAKLAEGRALAKHVLEPILTRTRVSFAYGYISPELSQEIVKYQDPAKPSYHRWDLGAAVDVMMHDYAGLGEPPIQAAFWMDEHLPVSRVITYSESPYICVGTRRGEIAKGDPRRALYENRYTGARKPLYIKYADTPDTRIVQKRKAMALPVPWQGAGYPTYHAGGTQGAEHIRTSRTTMLIDFLYSTRAVTEGLPNYPSLRAMGKFKRAGQLMDDLLWATKVSRFSIVRGYESPAWSTSTKHTWKEGIYLVLVPPEGTDLDWLAATAAALPGVHLAKVFRGHRLILGADLELHP